MLVVSREGGGRCAALVEELRAEFDVSTASRWDEALALVDVRPYEAVVVDMADGAGGIAERDGVGILRAGARAPPRHGARGA